MKKFSKAATLALFGLTMTSSTALAIPLVWTLNGGNFSDGGTFSGSFAYDASSNAYISVNISVTAGSVFGASQFQRGVVANSLFLSFLNSNATDLTGTHGLLFNLSGAGLTDAGGTISLTSGQEYVCLNVDCSLTSTTERFINAGATLTASTAPTPGPVLFSNLDPTGSISPASLGAVGPAQLAFPFTTPGYTANLEKLVIPLRQGIGSSNELDVTLVNDSFGQPGTTVVETIHLSGALGNTVAFISVHSALHPLLAASTTYWVIIGAADGDGFSWANASGTVLPVARNSTSDPWITSGSNSLGLDVVAMFNTNVGIFRSGFFWLEDVDGNRMFNTPPDRAFAFGGVPGDIPISGDWNGLGTTKVGVYRPSNGLFILDYDGDGKFTSADKAYNLGLGIQPGDIPVVGDWNGDGRDKVGIFRAGFLWILDTNGDGVFEQGTDQSCAFGGVAGDVPVVGDWTGTGTSKIGLFRQGFFWILDANGDGVLDNVNQVGGDQAFAYGGIQGDVPAVGDWDGSGTSKVGVFRNGFFWVLDANGNHQFDGSAPGQDLAFPFGGIVGDIPVVGKW